MVEVSENLRSQINADSRTFKAQLIAGEEVYEEIVSLRKSVIFPSSSMGIGNALSACIECTASDVPVSITGKKLKAQITIIGNEENLKLGSFTAEKPVSQDGNVIFFAYDAMVAAANIAYKSTLPEGEHTAQEYFNDICSVLGEECITLDEGVRSLVIEEDKLSGYSCRDALAYLAGYLGRNCLVNRDGLFEMVPFRTVDYDMLNADRIAEPALGDSDCVIGYITCCVDSETTLQTGTGSNGFELISPLMTQQRLDEIGAELMGEDSPVRVYRPGKIKQLLGDPTLEICDVVSMNFNEATYIIPVTSIAFDFDGGLQSEIESFDLAGSSSLSLSERLSFAQKQAQEKTGAYINAVVEFSQAIQKAYGVKSTTIGDITYFHDSEKIEDAKYIYCMTTQGIAFTDSWGGSHDSTIWKYGINKNGEALLNMLNVFHIKADLIEAGKLTSKDGKTYFDLDNGIVGTKVTKEDENGEEIVVYSYEQSAEGVRLSTGMAITLEDFLTDEKRAESENYAKELLGITGSIDDLPEIKKLLYKTLYTQHVIMQWTKANNGMLISCSDGNTSYQIQFSGNKVIFTKAEGESIAHTEYSIDGIKSKKRIKIDAPGIDLPVTLLTSKDDCNKIFDTGTYLYYTADRPVNAPYNNAALIKIEGADSTVSQKTMTATRYGEAGYSKYRQIHDGVWGPWCEYWAAIEDATYPGCYFRKQNGTTEWITPPMVEGAEYRTTERYEGKVVYTQKRTISKLPNAGTADLTLSVSGGIIDDLISLDLELYDATKNIRYTTPFVDLDGKLMISVCMNNVKRIATLKTFSDLSAYECRYCAKYTKK